MLEAVITDLDGVIRHFHDVGAAEADRLLKVPPGTMNTYAYDHADYDLAMHGVLTYDAWCAGVHCRLEAAVGPMAGAAVAAWRQDRGTLDVAAVALFREVRDRAVPLAVFSNCPDVLERDLVHHGIRDLFEPAVSSASIEICKPSPVAFRMVASMLGIEPGRILFTDDRLENVEGARRAGMEAVLWDDPDGFRRALSAHRLLS